MTEDKNNENNELPEGWDWVGETPEEEKAVDYKSELERLNKNYA